ncbi:Lipopolysaccharide biosynthesis protein RffA [plant metagenome]|uniref:Lipopolysaccharide biosynthesis protein RffA n=1 Tax=plant metagenome TaxID=1297885 RepID=A0A484PKM7_9ZZZZ
MDTIPFNRPPITGREIDYLKQVIESGNLAGDGSYTRKCHAWLASQLGSPHALLTHSCTGALEIAALLCDIQPGDEVIMPSFTFVSTANAFVLRGATCVFVDIRADTLNLDERLIEAAITDRTRAIVPVHYAGVGCDMDAINAIAAAHGLKVLEDAAQGLGATWRGRALGTLGDFGALSFHGTKNIVAGEGGALLVRDDADAERAEILREKGTDRSRFLRGDVDKYTWQDVGSSYLPSELTAAFLLAQLEDSQAITTRRLAAWQRYRDALLPLEAAGKLRLQAIPEEAQHNGHIFSLVLDSGTRRTHVLQALRDEGIQATSHYVSLHTSPAGQRHGRTSGALTVTEHVSSAQVRLPIYADITEPDQARVIATLCSAL